MTELSETQKRAADWLEANWTAAVGGGPLTRMLRERYGLAFGPAVKVIAEVNRRRASK